MAPTPVPDDLRRFILTSIASVPHLEALLLLRASPEENWGSGVVARRLYIVERLARKVLEELCAIGALRAVNSGAAVRYRYAPAPEGLADLIDRLALAYSSNLIGVSTLIHSQMDRHAQQFADAFTWKKDL